MGGLGWGATRKPYVPDLFGRDLFLDEDEGERGRGSPFIEPPPGPRLSAYLLDLYLDILNLFC